MARQSCRPTDGTNGAASRDRATLVYPPEARPAPLFCSGLADHYRDGREHESPGVVIVADDAQHGMLDIHDRRPVALFAADAALWMNLDLPYEQAAQIARIGTQLTDDFHQEKSHRFTI